MSNLRFGGMNIHLARRSLCPKTREKQKLGSLNYDFHPWSIDLLLERFLAVKSDLANPVSARWPGHRLRRLFAGNLGAREQTAFLGAEKKKSIYI